MLGRGLGLGRLGRLKLLFELLKGLLAFGAFKGFCMLAKGKDTDWVEAIGKGGKTDELVVPMLLAKGLLFAGGMV